GADARVLAALAAGGLANLLFAVGPRPHPWLPNFYGLLTTLLPGLAWVRVPMRAIAYTYLILCVLGASGLAAMLRRLQGGIARGLLAAGVFVLIVIEAGWRPIPLAQAPPRRIDLQPPPPPPADPPALARDGWRIAPAAGDLALDGDLETLWRGSVSERTPDRLTVDLGETATVTAVALDLGRHLRLYLRSYRVEGS